MDETASTPAPQKSWFGRNWKWFLPVGCLLPILVCCGGPIGIFYGVVSAIKSSDVYTVSLAKAKAHPEVQEALGDNIEAGFMAGGSFNLKNNDGDANITYDIKGSKGVAAVHVVGVKTAGKWEYSVMEVIIPAKNKNKTINLLDEHAGHDHDQNDHEVR